MQDWPDAWCMGKRLWSRCDFQVSDGSSQHFDLFGCVYPSCALTHVLKDPESRPFRAFPEVRFFKDNVWRFAAKLEGDRLEVGFGRGFGDLPTGSDGPGEGDLLGTQQSASELEVPLAEGGDGFVKGREDKAHTLSTSICLLNASPVILPKPLNKLNTPFG